jgi:MerR family copper efflux transcriptional regulator
MATAADGLRISEVVERTGFTGPTLRYYEEIGLLPPPGRTSAGYRIYGERDVARLLFIGRAKRLGCTLDEIRGLAEAWDDDRCGPVQHRLRSLVGAKLIEAQASIAELMTFTADLQATAAELAGEPVDGPCDDTCACLATADADQHHPVAVALGRQPAGEDVPIVCSLDGAGTTQRLADWQAVTEQVTRREPLAGGVRLVFGPDAPLDEIARLAAAEHECCPFFSFALTVDGRGTALEVTAPPGGADVLTAAFGSAAE